MPRQRLLVILSEYGEYPYEFRQLIWASLLKLPNNTTSFCKLLDQSIHNNVNCIQYHYSGPNFHSLKPNLLEKLKQIVSMLVQWSQILGVPFHSDESFLPNFAFPFVKFASTNMLFTFEMIASILINQCVLWFEFSPMLPLNYLGLVENLIEYFEPTLAEFYKRQSITSSVYAWKLMRSAFSDVLHEFQWYILWDHVISAPSYFLLFIIVAFNCVQCKSIRCLHDSKEIEAFFDEPTSINMQLWLRKAYMLMKNCPKEFHPRQYMEDNNNLSVDGQYKKILNYPHEQLQKRIKQQKQMEHQHKSINQRYMELEKMEMNLMQHIVNNAQVEEHRERLHNVDLVHDIALIDMASQLENQRQHLILSERQLNMREAMMSIMQKEDKLRNKISDQNFDLQKKLCLLARTVSSNLYFK